jgi:hypothetical protein
MCTSLQELHEHTATALTPCPAFHTSLHQRSRNHTHERASNAYKEALAKPGAWSHKKANTAHTSQHTCGDTSGLETLQTEPRGLAEEPRNSSRLLRHSTLILCPHICCVNSMVGPKALAKITVSLTVALSMTGDGALVLPTKRQLFQETP